MSTSVERRRQLAAIVLALTGLVGSTMLPAFWPLSVFAAPKDSSNASVKPQFGPGTSNNNGIGPLNGARNLESDPRSARAQHPEFIQLADRSHNRQLSALNKRREAEKHAQPDVEALLARLPVHFVENRGQSPGAVRFEVKAPHHKIFFTSNEVVFAAAHNVAGKRTAEALRLRFDGASASPAISGKEMLPGKFNYFIGNDASQWKTNVSSYKGVAYKGIYKGVDLVFKEANGQMERDFVIEPKVDPSIIRMTYEGAKKIRLSKKGELIVETQSSVLTESRPEAYQMIGGKRVEVAANYQIGKDRRVGFTVRKHDCSLPLIIDPALRFSTFLGGSGDDVATGIAVDDSGIYVVGFTNSINFPAPGAFGPLGGEDEFALKLTPDGSALVYSDVIGGSDNDSLFAAQVHPTDGSFYLFGVTASADFPVTAGAFDTSHNGSQDYNVTRINAAGNALVWSTYIGGAGIELDAGGIDVYNNGDCWIVGGTTSLGPSQSANPYPIATTFGTDLSPINNGSINGVATAIRFDGAQIIVSGFWGGSAIDEGYAVAINRSNLDFHYLGDSFSSNAPICAGVGVPFATCQAAGFDTTYNSGRDATITRFNNVGKPLGSTYLGDPITAGAEDRPFAMALDAANPPNIYIAGSTSGPGYPTTPGAFDTTYNGGIFDQVVTKLNATLSALVYSTFIGGSGEDEASAIAVDAAGNAYISGYTNSVNFPVTFSGPLSGGDDVTVTKLNPAGSGLLLSSYIGGSGEDRGLGIRLNSSGTVATVVGGTVSVNFPTTPGAFDETFNGGLTDAFVTQVDTVFDLCIRAPNRVLLVNLTTGAFKYCGPGGPISGTGLVSTNGCTVTIASPQANIVINTCSRSGRARLFLSSGPLLMLDPNLDDNQCICP